MAARVFSVEFRSAVAQRILQFIRQEAEKESKIV